MASSLICSSPRSPRFLPLIRLDIALALGKAELHGDAEADAAEQSFYGCDVEDDDPNLDEYGDWMGDWPYDDEGDNDCYAQLSDPDPEELEDIIHRDGLDHIDFFERPRKETPKIMRLKPDPFDRVDD